MLSILTKPLKDQLRDLTKTLVSISTDHSTLSLSFLSIELLNAMVPTMFGKEDGERMLWVNNGSSMESPRLSRITNGRITHLTFNQMEDPQTSDVLPLTQDGGNFGEAKEASL
jgi:hypothetical protein